MFRSQSYLDESMIDRAYCVASQVGLVETLRIRDTGALL